ncbi:hypothetical protein [Marinitoga lauensis]|uniref:hypothetical protein n=1 Tax=Marinitoga lauensis TaxID=2201189 RepID=UPI00101216F1|nr:hypothetical protein [Marinitoga lauensis]
MNKYFTLIILIIAVVGMSYVNVNGYLETSWTYTFDSTPAQFYYNGLKLDLYIKPEDSNFSGSLNLNKGNDNKYYVTDGEFDFKFKDNLLKTFWKRKEVNTTDWINAFNNEKIGAVNGLMMDSNFSFAQIQNYLFKKDGGTSSFYISHIRGMPFGDFYYSFIYAKEYLAKYNYTDWRLFDFNLDLNNTQFFGEFGYSYDKGEFYLEDNYLIFLGNRINLNDLSNAIFFKYISSNYNRIYLPDSFVNNIRNELSLNKWNINMDFDYYFKDNKISFNNFSLKYLKGYLNYNNYNYLYLGIPVEEYNVKDVEGSINFPLYIPKIGNVNFSFYKKGWKIIGAI